jgi:uncharacterized cupredoxin-like copper-binding protein
MHQRVLASIALGGLLLSVAPTGALASTESATPLRFTERDLRIAADQSTVPAGKVEARVRNRGQLEHELVAFRTDLGEDALPMTADGQQVDEHGPGVTHIDPEAEDVEPGSTKTVTLQLDPGRYVFICNLPGHYRGGMHVVVIAR